MTSVQLLPNEILAHVATFLTPKDLVNCSTVSDRFCATSRDNSLWRKFFVDLNTISCPAGRLCHTSVMNGSKMYVYGGHITQPSSEYFHTVKQDMFECDLSTRTWREVPVAEGAPKRTEHTAVVYNESMVVFGGYSGSGYENSVMLFDFATATWTQMATQGEAPSARSAHTAVMVGHCMYVFGGWNGVHCMNDLHELNFQTKTWSLLCADTSSAARLSGTANHAHSIYAHPGAASRNDNAGELPSARCSHGAVLVGEGQEAKMYVFGGYAIEGATESANKGYLHDLYEFHFATQRWYKSAVWGNGPSPRSRFRMVSYNNSIFLFAGWNSTKHFNTLHRYNTTTKQWLEMDSSFDADGIGQFSMVEHQGIMYVFSGFSPNVGCRNNLFAYHLPSACAHRQAF